MKIEYFEETDTLQITFKEGVVADTYDLDENTLIEVDEDRELITMTLEHANQRTDLQSLLYRTYPGSAA